jgi:hypothetical protein
MSTFELDAITPDDAVLGRAAVFVCTPKWDWNSDLTMTFLGFTEGDVTVAQNEEYQTLTLPEYTGSAPRKANVQGAAPVVTIPLFTADPALLAILSPSGTASQGFGRQRPVVERTLVVFPEELFLSADGQVDLSLDSNGGTWQLGGSALSTAKSALLDKARWFWRGYFTTPDTAFSHADAGKRIDETQFVVMFSDDAPNGHGLYTVGDPYDAGIDIETGDVES